MRLAVSASGVRRAIVALAALWVSTVAQAQDDGARAYTLVPDGTQIATVQGIFLRANQSLAPGTVIPDADFEIDIAVLQFTQTFSIGGSQAAVFGALPLGEVRGSLDLPGRTIAGKSSGAGDATLGAIVGLVGSPALAAKDFVAFRPALSLGILGKLILPTGAYDSEKLINLGANRFTYQIGLPMTYSIGKSPLDPALTTFELLPTVTFFDANDDPFGANRVKQDPLLGIEAHLTHNIGPAVWLSADARYSYGGETATDGVDDDNVQESLALGGTANVAFNRRLSFKLTYGGIVARSDNGADGWMLRGILNLVL